MTKASLKKEKCIPCAGGIPPMSLSEIQEHLRQLPSWALSVDNKTIFRRFTFKGFAKAIEMANLAAWLGNKMGHHPDVCFGWGYCEIHYTSHESDGLTENDFLCARRLEELVA